MKAKVMKKWLIGVLSLVLCLGLTACGFSVGNAGGKDDYKDLFPDRAETLGNAYKTSNVGYDYSLGEYGKMKLYVDTSEGHSFELDQTYGGFVIKDKDGNEVLHTYPLQKDEYANMTAITDEIKTINGRQFFYSVDNLYRHAYTYLADCGIDCGMLLETGEDETGFSLVAFRGTPIDGASSDPYTYKGTAASTEEVMEEVAPEDTVASEDGNLENTEPADPDVSGATEDPSVAAAAPEGDVTQLLANLQTDYNKINWGVSYSLDEQLPYLVVSIAPYVAYDEIHLLIGFTNLYNDNISLSGEAVALGADDAEIGSTYIYTGAIGGGNTVLADINCGDQKPDGRIRWEEITSETDTLTTYVPWEADWAIEDHISDSYLTVNYEFYGAGGQAIVPGEVHFVLLDEQGNVLAKDMTYLGDEVAAGEKYAGSEDIYSDKELLSATKDMAIFATSTK